MGYSPTTVVPIERTVAMRRSDEGASSVEYALIVTAIAGLIVFAVFALGGITLDLFTGTCEKIDSQAQTGNC